MAEENFDETPCPVKAGRFAIPKKWQLNAHDHQTAEAAGCSWYVDCDVRPTF